jgi:hypothetical protein
MRDRNDRYRAGLRRGASPPEKFKPSLTAATDRGDHNKAGAYYAATAEKP